MVAGHKGQPRQVKKKAEKVAETVYARSRGTAAKEKPPIFGMIQRGGEVAIQMLENVKKKTIEPIIKATIKAGTLIFTDEHTIYNGLTAIINKFVIVQVNTLEMKTVTDFMRYK